MQPHCAVQDNVSTCHHASSSHIWIAATCHSPPLVTHRHFNLAAASRSRCSLSDVSCGSFLLAVACLRRLLPPHIPHRLLSSPMVATATLHGLSQWPVASPPGLVVTSCRHDPAVTLYGNLVAGSPDQHERIYL